MTKSNLVRGAVLAVAAFAGVATAFVAAGPAHALSLVGVVDFTHPQTVTVGEPVTYTIEASPSTDTISDQLDFDAPVVPVCGADPQRTINWTCVGRSRNDPYEGVAVFRPTQPGVLNANFSLADVFSNTIAAGTDSITVVASRNPYDHVYAELTTGGTIATTDPGDPIGVSIRMSTLDPGSVVPISIDESATTGPAKQGQWTLGQTQVEILDGGFRASPDDPFVITFVTPDNVNAIFHDDGSGRQKVDTCAASGPPVPPCATSTTAGGSTTWTVYTAEFSTWTFGIPDQPSDTTPPSLALPFAFAVDATSPSGAVVAYSVAAADTVDATPWVGCTPAAGSAFAIGITTVSCAASDHSGNVSTGSFSVTVRGAKEQLGNLAHAVLVYAKLPATTRAALTAQLDSLVARFDPSNALQVRATCFDLRLFVAAVRLLHPAPAADWINAAMRIENVVAC